MNSANSQPNPPVAGQRQKEPNVQQSLFIDHYLGDCHFEGKAAAIAAGYSPNHAKVRASKLLAMPHIKAAIQERISAVCMTRDEVLMRLADHARGDIGEFIKEDGSLDLAKARREGKTHLIKKVSRVATPSGTNTAIELYDAQAALVQIGRHHKLFTDNIEHSGEINGVSDEHRKAIEDLLGKLSGLAANAGPAAVPGEPDPGAA